MFEQYNLTSLDTESLDHDKLDDIPQKWEGNIYLFGGTALKIQQK